MKQKKTYICNRFRTIKHLKFNIARIAQLVEHDLAKVGDAGSNPVSRSKVKIFLNHQSTPLGWWNGRHAGLKILCLYGRAGSSPAPSTKTLIVNEGFFMPKNSWIARYY